MAATTGRQPGFPEWLPEKARIYLQHTSDGRSIRDLARATGSHASTVLRRVRRMEQRRDDPLLDEALDQIWRCASSADSSDETSINGEPTDMNAQAGPLRVPHIAEDEVIVREARRILRRLCEAGTMLAVAPELTKAVVLKGTQRLAVIERAVAQAFAVREWIAVATSGKVTTYAITAVGRAALKRMLAEDSRSGPAAPGAGNGFAEQHRSWDERRVRDHADGRERRVRYNLSESPLTALARRRDKDGERFLTLDQVAAGERLREDFELAQLGPRVAQNWDRFLTAGVGTGGGPGSEGGGSNAARDRVARALHDLGPGLGDMVLRTCCFLEGLEIAERNLGWSARSGKIVLRIALTRLMRHYEETYGKSLPLIG